MLPQPDHDGPIRIVIADDHTLVRDGLKRILEDEPDFRVVAEAQDGEQAVAAVLHLDPDVLLLDVAMPKLDGIGVLRRLADTSSRVHTILLTAGIEKSEISTALHLGTRGLILKTSAIDVLVKSIRCVLAGEYWVDRSTLAEIVHDSQAANPNFGLTPREIEIVAEVASGSCNKDIANKFSISDKTVKRHLANIFEKLGVTSRLELAVLAMNRQLLGRQRTNGIKT